MLTLFFSALDARLAEFGLGECPQNASFCV